jgi:DNA photolyase
MDKHSSLLRTFVNYGRRKFYNTGPRLLKSWGITYLTFESDPEPFGHIRDHNVEAMCKELGITVVKENSHTLYDLDK